MKIYGHSYVVYLVISIYFLCNCKPAPVLCPAFDFEYTDWITYNIGDTISFKNKFNERIYFIVSNIQFTLPYIESCTRGSAWSLNCPECKTKAELFATSNSIRNGQNYLSIALYDVGYSINKTIRFRLFSHNTAAYYKPEFGIIDSTNVMLDTITINNKIYNNVMVSTMDTTLKSDDIWKIYINRKYKIIGFHDKKTNSIFHLE